MKILHIITRMIQGGAQHVVIMTAKGQVDAGHDVTITHGPVYGPEGSYVVLAEQSGAAVIELPAMHRAVRPWRDWRCIGQLRKLIRDIQPDVVHTHSSKAGILGRIAAWKEKVPCVVHTIHGLGFHDRQSMLTRRTFIRAEKIAAKRCHKIIGVSAATVREFRRRNIGKADQFTIVHAAIDIDEFEQWNETFASKVDVIKRSMGLNPDGRLIGVVARLDKLKGHNDLLDVLPGLFEKYPNLQVLFVGDGFYRKAVEGRLKWAKLQDRVVITGTVPLSVAAQLMIAMEVVALPSYQEGQPLVLAEALLCGCAIVGYDIGGVGEICINRQTGRLVKVGDKKGLAKCIDSLLSYPDERTRMVDQGRQLVYEQFGRQQMIERTLQVYEQVLPAQRDAPSDENNDAPSTF